MKKSAPTPQAEIHIAQLETTGDHALAPSTARSVAPAFSPGRQAHVAFMELGAKTDQLRVVTTQGKAVAAFEMKGLRAFVWDVSGGSLYALSLAGRTRGRVAVCDVATGTQAEATVVSSVEDTSLAMSPEKGTVWMAGGNPETRITGLFKMKSTGNNSPWSLALRMPGPWSSIAVHPVSGIVHGLLHIEGALQLVNEGKPRSPLEVFFKGVDTKAAHHHQVALNQDGTLVAFVHGGELHVVGAPGSPATRLKVPGDGVCGAPAWHPDGKRVACVRGGAIHVVDAASGAAKVVAGAVAVDDRIAFTPDGGGIAYARAG